MLSWRPTATRETLVRRAQHLEAVRAFFKKRGVLEVETPLLMRGIGTDVQLSPIQVNTKSTSTPLFLQTSPEFAMKRLLAADSGPIYQICKAFRDEEKGQYHNIEFSMLEWYRPGWSLDELIGETFDLFTEVSGWQLGEMQTYQSLFEEYLGFCPHTISLSDLHQRLIDEDMVSRQSIQSWSQDTCLDCLLTHKIQPFLGHDRPIAITEYPASQAALAVVEQKEGFSVGRRFEVYYQGIELANGYDELIDPQEQRDRFVNDNQERSLLGLSILPVDELLLAALESGIPTGSGVALGLDRWIMLSTGCTTLRAVQSFFD